MQLKRFSQLVLIFFLLLGAFINAANSQQAFAYSYTVAQCSSVGIQVSQSNFPNQIIQDASYPDLTINLQGSINPNYKYKLNFFFIQGVIIGGHFDDGKMENYALPSFMTEYSTNSVSATSIGNNQFAVSFTIPGGDTISKKLNSTNNFATLNYFVELQTEDGNTMKCEVYHTTLFPSSKSYSCGALEINQDSRIHCIEQGNVDWKISGVTDGSGKPAEGNFKLVYRTANSQLPILGDVQHDGTQDVSLSNGGANGSVKIDSPVNQPFTMYLTPDGNVSNAICTLQVPISFFCTNDVANITPTPSPNSSYYLCAQIPVDQTQQRTACCKCAGLNGTDNQGNCVGSGSTTTAQGLWTAVGCIPTQPSNIISTVIKIGLSISGGVALLMIMSAAFMLTTSQGEPKKANEAKELLTSAVMGLLFIIFSITMLRFIGVNILEIPGFGTQSISGTAATPGRPSISAQ